MGRAILRAAMIGTAGALLEKQPEESLEDAELKRATSARPRAEPRQRLMGVLEPAVGQMGGGVRGLGGVIDGLVNIARQAVEQREERVREERSAQGRDVGPHTTPREGILPSRI